VQLRESNDRLADPTRVWEERKKEKKGEEKKQREKREERGDGVRKER
jgi:hypothetical protein